MTTDIPNLQSVLNRLETLEKQNRRLKQVGMAALVLVSALVLMGQAAAKNRTVEANEFIVKGLDGRVRAWFGVDSHGCRLQMFDSQKRSLVSIGVRDMGGGWLTLDDPEHGNSAALRVDSGTPVGGWAAGSLLVLHDSDGFEAMIGNNPALTSSITGERTATSAASVVLSDKDRKVIWRAP